MNRLLSIAPVIVAACILVAPSAGRQALPTSHGFTSLAPVISLSALDSRLAGIALSGHEQGPSAAIAKARSQGLLVAQGKVRVLVHARAGHVAGARIAVRRANGTVIIATGKLIEALIAPKSLHLLAASRHIARVKPVEAAPAGTVMGLRMASAHLTGSEVGATAPAALEFEGSNVADAPTDVTAEAGDGQARVTFTPPASDGGDEILYHTATAYPGGRQASSTDSEIIVGGLTNGVSYTFTVDATNDVGIGPESEFSNSVTPDGSSRLQPPLPSAGSRPAIPGFTAPGGPRKKPHHDVPEY